MSTDGGALSSVELRVRKLIAGRLQGDQSGIRLGPGGEPEEVVRYRPGEDDVRRIDWNVTARSQTPHVWRPRAEHELETWVLLDETASMAFGTSTAEKGEVATGVAGAIGLLTDRPGNRLGFLRLHQTGLRRTPAIASRRAARGVLRRGPSREREGTAAAPTLREALVALERVQTRPGLRVVVSDFVEPDGRTERPFTWEPALRRLAARHDLLVVELIDPRELDLADVGVVTFEDPETGHRCEVWTGLPGLRERYAETARHHRAEVGAAVRRAGAAHVVLRTDRDWIRDLVRHVLARQRVPRSRRVR